MGLVDYGSGSEEEDEDQSKSRPEETSNNPSNPFPKKITETQNDSNSALAPNRPLPPRKNKPTKARIFLDLPPPSNSNSIPKKNSNKTNSDDGGESFKRKIGDDGSEEEGEDGDSGSNSISKKKRPNLVPGSGAGPKRSGLAGLLPPPKQITINKGNSTPQSNNSTLLKPRRFTTETSNNDKILTTSDLPTAKNFGRGSETILSDSTIGGGASLFGLPLNGSDKSLPSSSSNLLPAHPSSSSSSSTLTKLQISSAPQVTEELPPPPSLLDPYPGYWKKSNGEWCERSPDDPIWQEFYKTHYADPNTAWTHDNDGRASTTTKGGKGSNYSIPKDFFGGGGDPGRASGIEEFDAAKVARDAWENKPKVIDPREEARKEQAAAAAAAGKASKQISARARGRHQLTSLLNDAQANRAELEDRISRGKFNRKAGGAKYGF